MNISRNHRVECGIFAPQETLLPIAWRHRSADDSTSRADARRDFCTSSPVGFDETNQSRKIWKGFVNRTQGSRAVQARGQAAHGTAPQREKKSITQSLDFVRVFVVAPCPAFCCSRIRWQKIINRKLETDNMKTGWNLLASGAVILIRLPTLSALQTGKAFSPEFVRRSNKNGNEFFQKL